MTIDLSIPDPSLGPAGEALPPFADGTVRDAAAFRARMEAWQLYVSQAGAALTKRAAGEMIRALVSASPVGNPTRWKRPGRRGYVGGHFRRNWQISVGGAPATEVPGVDPAGSLATDTAYAAIAALQPGQGVLISNPVAYAEVLAHGWSKQAAAGWVDAAVAGVWDRLTRAK